MGKKYAHQLDSKIFGIIRWFFVLPNDDPRKSIFIAGMVCLFCSIIVATSAVYLKPLQTQNREQERIDRLLQIIGKKPMLAKRLRTDDNVKLRAEIVDISTGKSIQFADSQKFNQRQATKEVDQSIAIDPQNDIAQLKLISKTAVVYHLYENDELKIVIIPIHGRGYNSMLFGYLGLTSDTESVVGLSFYEHSETPGLGSLIDTKSWLDQWNGKKVWDDRGEPGLGVARGIVDLKSPEATYLVDGITGATWTSQGVHNLIRFWLGDLGFGPYLKKLRERRR